MRDHPPVISFVGLGAQKAGTTWLFRCLEEHPGLRGATRSNNKELNFFNLRWEYGFDWYEAQFDPAGRQCGEFSPQYLPTPGLAERMHAYNPDLRLLVVLREPVDRAVSQHRHLIGAGLLAPTTTFRQAVERNPTYLAQGRYATLLQPYREVFGPDQVHVAFYDDIEARPETVVRAAYDALGVDPDFVPFSLTEVVNPSIDARRRGIELATRTIAPKARRLLGPQRMGQLRRLGVGRLARRLSGMQHTPPDPTIGDDYLASLRDAFVEENARLASLVGPDVPPWVGAP